MKATYLIYIKGNANYKISKSAYAYTIVDVRNNKSVSGGGVSDTYNDSHVKIEHKALRSALKWILDHSNHFILHDTFIIRTSLSFVYTLFQQGHSLSLDTSKNIYYTDNYDEESCLFMLRFDDIHVEHSLTDSDPYMKYTKKLVKKILRNRPLSEKTKDFEIAVSRPVACKINDISKYGTRLWHIMGLLDAIHSYKRFINFSNNHHKYSQAKRQIESMCCNILKNYKYIYRNDRKKIINDVPILTKQNIKCYINNYNYKLNGNISDLIDGINYCCKISNDRIIINKEATLSDINNVVNDLGRLALLYVANHRNKFLRYKHNLLRDCNVKVLYNKETK